MTVIIGITGGVACGKSALAACFKAQGCAVHDADATVHGLMVPGGAAVPAVLEAFPTAVLEKEHKAADRAVDRAVLRELIFDHPDQRKILESILHPMVKACRQRWLQSAKGLVILDIPLLFETGAEQECTLTMCAWCEADVQVQRLMARGLTPDRAQTIIAAQMPLEIKKQRADICVDMNDSLPMVRAWVENFVAACAEASTKVALMEMWSHARPA